MKKIYSLKSKREFNKIINDGKKISNSHFLISYVESSDFKIGISVPKKLGNAVFRNYNKRVVKNLIPQINIFNKKAHTVIIIRKKFTTLSFEEKRQILTSGFEKING